MRRRDTKIDHTDLRAWLARPLSEALRLYAQCSAHFGTPEKRERARRYLAAVRTLREESEALEQIRTEYGNDRSLCISRYREFIAAHPKSELAYSALAVALRLSGDLEGCTDTLRTAIALAEEDGSTVYYDRLMYCDVLRQNGQLNDAISGFQELLITPARAADMKEITEPLIYLCLGNALHAKGDHEAARSAWKEATKPDKSDIGYKKEVRERLRVR